MALSAGLAFRKRWAFWSEWVWLCVITLSFWNGPEMPLLLPCAFVLLAVSGPVLTSGFTRSSKCLPDYSQEYARLAESPGASPACKLMLGRSGVSYFLSADKKSGIAYRVVLGVALLAGSFSGPPEGAEPCLTQFRCFADANGWSLAGLLWEDKYRPAWEACQLRAVPMGDEALVRPAVLLSSLPKSLRNAYAKVAREGGTVSFGEPPYANRDLAVLKGVSAQWLTIPGKRDWQFPHGGLAEANLKHMAVAVLRNAAGNPQAFLSYALSPTERDASIDLMRHTPSVPSGAMDALICALCKHVAERGCMTLSLGLAPFSGHRVGAPEGVGLRWIFGPAFRGLRSYKQKFNPSWEPQYLIYEGSGLEFLRLGCALAMAILIDIGPHS